VIDTPAIIFGFNYPIMTAMFSDFARKFPDKPNISILGREHLINMELSKGKGPNYSRVVLIDDDSLTNMLNKKIIQSINTSIPIFTFLHVDEALDFLKETDQKGDALIFLDINFPQKNGWDFLDDYRHFKICSTVIMLSSSIDKNDKQKSKEYTMVIDYVSKPLSFEYVESVLGKGNN
jgi:response regulator RpfG family c-di-GMP phosphodiesterase